MDEARGCSAACVRVCGRGAAGGCMNTLAFPCVHIVGELAAVIASGRLPQVLQMLAAVPFFFFKLSLLFIYLFSQRGCVACTTNACTMIVLHIHGSCSRGMIINIHSGVTWKAGGSPLTAAFNYSAASLHMHE